MKITRKLTIRGTEPDLNCWMQSAFYGGLIQIRLGGSETIQDSKGAKHQSYEGKLTMSVAEAFTLIAELQKAVQSAYPKESGK